MPVGPSEALGAVSTCCDANTRLDLNKISMGPQNAPWESRNGYIPPPRFQQLRALQQQQQQQQQQQFGPQMPTSHSRSTSFFSFFGSTNAAQTSVLSRSPSTNVKPVQTPVPSIIPQSQGNHRSQQLNQPPQQVTQQPQQNSAPPQQQLQSLQHQQGAPANMAQGPNPQQSLVSQSPTSTPLHPEIRSLVQLTVAHAHKIYFSGPLVRRLERQPDGQKPSKDDGWIEVWAQLGGTTLSIWDMKEIQEASKQGKEVPPSYVNVQDAVCIFHPSLTFSILTLLPQFVQVLGSVTTPATSTLPSRRYANVLTLNTAGSNLLLFSCPSTPALISWAAALRLASWEKSRLEEIYTAHLIRITLNGKFNHPLSFCFVSWTHSYLSWYSSRHANHPPPW